MSTNNIDYPGDFNLHQLGGAGNRDGIQFDESLSKELAKLKEQSDTENGVSELERVVEQEQQVTSTASVKEESPISAMLNKATQFLKSCFVAFLAKETPKTSAIPQDLSQQNPIQPRSYSTKSYSR